MNVTVRRGEEATRRLANDAFGAEWDGLWERCPWATSFQTRAFVAAWYVAYEGVHGPVLVEGRNESGELRGLLALAVDPDGELDVAGTQHAEYQSWLSERGDAESFMGAVHGALGVHWPRYALTFRYLPTGAPVDVFEESGVLGRVSEVRSWVRPLLGAIEGGAALEKKRYRARLRYLERGGPLRWERVVNPARLARVLDEVVALRDLRQCAHNGVPPFDSDPRQRELYGRLLEAGLLHASLLWAGDTLISAQLNVLNGSEVALGLVAHAPGVAKYSPGRIHLYLLARELSADGYERVDLTPGGDTYKDELSTEAERVDLVTMLARPGMRTRLRAVRGLRRLARRGLKLAGVEPKGVKEAWSGVLERLRSRTWPGSWRWAMCRMRERLWAREEWALLRLTRPSTPAGGSAVLVREDPIVEVVAHRPGRGEWARRAYLRRALSRLEGGGHVILGQSSGRRLLAWVERPDGAASASGLPVAPTKGAALLFDVETDAPPALLPGLLAGVSARAFRTADASELVLASRADSAVARVAEELGAVRLSRLERRWRLGRERWSKGNGLTAALLIAAAGLLSGCGRGGTMTLEPASGWVWDEAEDRTVYFGHQSVGADLLAGVAELEAEARGRGPSIVEWTGAGPTEVGRGAVIHFRVGRNGDPASKAEAFRRAIERLDAHRGLAFYKHCFLDITAATDVAAVFREYERGTERVRAEFPGLTLAHVTVPLTAAAPAKEWLRRVSGRPTVASANAARQRFNRLLRRTYSGRDPVFDLARVESTLSDGSRTYRMVAGDTAYSLARMYTSDGGHLNEAGRRVVATAFLRFLARAGEATR